MELKEDHKKTSRVVTTDGMSAMSRVTRLTWRVAGPSLSVILSEVSDPQELLSLIS